ncbi:MAG TPA: hypothetical protein VKQ71_08225 [Acidimicrobiales bacterium]|nr:hypothetical protein [Acidimicrobiales bacterium]
MAAFVGLPAAVAQFAPPVSQSSHRYANEVGLLVHVPFDACSVTPCDGVSEYRFKAGGLATCVGLPGATSRLGASRLGAAPGATRNTRLTINAPTKPEATLIARRRRRLM